MFSHIYRSLIRSRKCPQAYTMLLSLPAADTSFGPPPEYLGARFIRPARRQLADEHRYLVGKAPVPFGSRTGPIPAPDRERGGAAPGLSELPRAMPAAQCPSWGDNLKTTKALGLTIWLLQCKVTATTRTALGHEQTSRPRQSRVCLCSVNRLQSAAKLALDPRLG
jgi:hypothetical protein